MIPVLSAVLLGIATLTMVFFSLCAYAPILSVVYRFVVVGISVKLCKLAQYDMNTVLFVAGAIAVLSQCFVFIGVIISLLSCDAFVIATSLSLSFLQEVIRRLRIDTMV